jgi:hypothetical protein
VEWCWDYLVLLCLSFSSQRLRAGYLIFGEISQTPGILGGELSDTVRASSIVLFSPYMDRVHFAASLHWSLVE